MYLLFIVYRSRKEVRITYWRHPGRLPIPLLQAHSRRWLARRAAEAKP